MKKIFMALILILFLGRFAYAKEEITISFVGDVNPQILLNKSKKQLKHLRQVFSGSDIVFANLESPITTGNQKTPGKSWESIGAGHDFIFKSHPKTVKKLKFIGFSVFSLANNHMMDYCVRGLKDTQRYLTKFGFYYCGAGKNIKEAYKPVIIQVKKIRVAFISYSEIIPACARAISNSPGIVAISYPPTNSNYKNIKKSIEQAKKLKADIVVVSLHWGLEGSNKIENYQRLAAQKILNMGADCIIGHHPHVLRVVDTYCGKTIAYSLGNFIFASSSDRPTKILKIKFTKNNGKWWQRIKIIPMYIYNGIPTKK